MTGVERLDARREFWRAVHVECRTHSPSGEGTTMDNPANERQAEHQVLAHIQDLVAEEHRLLEKRAAGDADHDRLTRVQVELDQCWDLLRQRRALRETGSDPGRAEIRPPDIVEKYIG